MKVLIYGGDQLQMGLYQPGGGEGRYALNLAESFALQGHDVTLWGSTIVHQKNGRHSLSPPKWGHCPPVKNIRMASLNDIEGKSFDLLLNCPLEYQDARGRWCKPNELRVTCNKKVIVLFSWNDSIEDNLVDNYLYGKIDGFVIGQPYPQKKTIKDRIPLAWVPFPFFNRDTPVNKGPRDQITWACKDVFSDEWGEDRLFHPAAAIMLEAIQRLCVHRDLTLNYISSHTLSGKRAERFNALNLIKQIPKKNMIRNYVSYDVMLKWMDHSMFCVVFPGYSAAFFDAVGKDCFAMFYEEEGPGSFASMTNTDYRVNMSMSADEVFQRLDGLWTQPGLREELIGRQRQALEPYTYQESYKQTLISLGL